MASVVSKRVSNQRRSQMAKAPARSTRIRLGFYRQRRITNVERAMEKHRREHVLGATMGREEKKTFAALIAALIKLMPKTPARRGVR